MDEHRNIFNQKGKNFYGNYPLNTYDHENIEVVETSGLICDPVGFRQHTGECWSDSLIQLILFCDGIKMVSQPFFFRGTKESFDAAVEPGPQHDYYVRLLMLIKQRLINKYKLLTSFRQTYGISPERLINRFPSPVTRHLALESCLNPLKVTVNNAGLTPGQAKRRKWMEMANRTAKRQMHRRKSFVRSTATKNIIFKLPRGNTTDTFAIEILNLILSLLNLPNVVTNPVLHYTYVGLYDNNSTLNNAILENRSINGAYASGYMIPLQHYVKGIDGIIRPKVNDVKFKEIVSDNSYDFQGHAVAFYKCNGVLYYYDDNYGIFKCPDGLDIRKINCIFYDSKNNAHYLKAGWEGKILERRNRQSTDYNFKEDVTIFSNGEMRPFTDVAETIFPPESDVLILRCLQIISMIYINVYDEIPNNNISINSNILNREWGLLGGRRRTRRRA